jgi:galactokinase
MDHTFQELFGQPREGCWAAPGRLNLIGEFVDYNEGHVMPLPLEQQARVEAARRSDPVLAVWSAQQPDPPIELPLRELEPGKVSGWAAYLSGVVWVTRKRFGQSQGISIRLDSEVPIGAGLSSSAAIECATALALNDLFELHLDRLELAKLAQAAEVDFVGVPCGLLDQVASLCAERGHVMLLDTRELTWELIPFEPEAQGVQLVVVDTRVHHDLGNSGYAQRRHQCEAAAKALGLRALRDVDPGRLPEALERLDDPVLRRRVRHVVTEQQRVRAVAELLRQNRIPEIGPILTEAHRSVRDDFEASSPEQDTVVEAALGAGALGARMVGGGFGGSVVVLTPIDRAEAVSSEIVSVFSRSGFAEPRFIAVS